MKNDRLRASQWALSVFIAVCIIGFLGLLWWRDASRNRTTSGPGSFTATVASEFGLNEQDPRSITLLKQVSLLCNLAAYLELLQENGETVSHDPNSFTISEAPLGKRQRLESIARVCNVPFTSDGKPAIPVEYTCIVLRTEIVIALIGPNAKKDMPPSILVSRNEQDQSYEAALADATYDPTNGISSKGDIVARIRLGTNAGNPTCEELKSRYLAKPINK